MNKHAAITAALDSDTLAAVERLARARGISSAEFAADAIRQAAQSETDFAAFVEKGATSIARGDFREHDAFMGDLRQWRETRVRPPR